jgi:hypothetical protein
LSSTTRTIDHVAQMYLTRRWRTIPADQSRPPTDKRARAASPEMRTWTAAQLRAFLDWSRGTDDEGFTA